jgi:hypothetical protein
MEFLIPGLILVALMAYASTRIKRSAAKAFEAETIETDKFSLTKPEGFLHVLNGDPAFAFQAYSKEFGTGNSSERRQATIELSLVSDKGFDAVCTAAEKTGKPINDEKFQLDGMKMQSTEIERNDGAIDYIDHYFIVDSPHGVYEMRTSVLEELNEELSPKINEMQESLTVKK